MENNPVKMAVLLMAYGTPNSRDEVEPYYTDIRGGHKPSPENLRELIARYERIGGRTPLLDITRQQARTLEALLDADGGSVRAYVGMKHWHPYIGEALQEIVRDGMQRVIALPLAPHYSRFSVGGYFQLVRDALQKFNATLDIRYIESWNDHPLFLDSIAERMEDARRTWQLASWNEIQVVFSAHSLPERILQENDPYPQELNETCIGVAERLGLTQAGWRFAFQSAGRTSEKWLGPDILSTLDALAAEGRRRILIAPIGFVSDHLEILYDIDVECADRAQRLGLEMRRIQSPNTSPAFMNALAAIVREHSLAISSEPALT